MEPLFDPGELAGVKILLAEDDQDSRELLESFLSLCGASVFAFENAREALRAFHDLTPDVVISDIWMAGGDGYLLLQHIRELPPERGGRTPAIALSAGAPADESLRAGFDVHLTKPFEPLKLVDIVRRFAKGES